IGMDRLEERLARFLGPAATARCIPEGVKRFATWAPLLIPFYIPRGADWDYAWSQAEVLQRSQGGGLRAILASLPLDRQLLLLAGVVAASTALCAALRQLRKRLGTRPQPAWSLANAEYEVTLKA